ncbi:MAG: DNA ligase D, partial [Beijerinckiaceae bacterium]
HRDPHRGAKTGPSRAPGESAYPRFDKPQLCDPRPAPPSGEDWIGEIKYDGYRLQVHIANGRARALTRSGRDWSEKFPGIVAAAAKIEAKEAILDGEAVVFDSDGISDFKALVAGFEKGSKHSVYQAFDLLALDGKDLTGKALLERKKMLKALLSGAPRTIRYTEHVAGDLQVLFERVVAGGAEGIIAKRATAPYRSGRGSAWQKIKGEARTDVTVVGFRPSHRGRPFASLLTAREENGGLRFAGAVGTGFSMQQMQDIKTRLRAHELKNPWRSLLDSDRAPADAIWVRPYYEAEVAIASWTRDGSMRHARFLALKKSPVKSRSSKRPKAKKIETRPAKTPTTPRGRSSHIDPFGITVTSADRIIFPAAAVTKGEIAAYYAKIAPKMFPFVANRPVSVLRAPEGISGETFFQRHPARGMDEGLETFKSGGKSYFAICEKSGLVEIAQFGGVEIHGWGVTRDALGSPDRVVFDLDPDETVPFAEVKNVAIRFRDALAAAGLASYAMVTGGKGVHVIVPLDATQAWAAVRAFSSGFAHKMAAADLSLVAVASKQKRKGKIFVDWLRNTPKATAVAPYSLRAREGAAVAMPVTWSELKRVNAADQFHMDDALRRKMPWTDYEDNRKPIPKGVLDLLATEGN